MSKEVKSLINIKIAAFSLFLLSFLFFWQMDIGSGVFDALFLSEERQAELSMRPCLTKETSGEQVLCMMEILPALFEEKDVLAVMAGFERNIEKIGETRKCHE